MILPALTLITSVLNAMPYFGAMLASLPRDDQIELLTIDAGSTDGTLEEVSRWKAIRLIKRPGMPLYTAWNEAIREARSPFVAFVNGDDVLPNGAVEAMLEAITDPVDVVCGQAEAFSVENPGPDTSICYSGKTVTGLGLPVLTFGAPIINAKIFRRDLILDAGGFDESLAFSADREFLLRLAIRHIGLTSRIVDKPFYRYRIHDRSMTLNQTATRRTEIAGEHCRIAERYIAMPGLEPATRQLLRAWLTHEKTVMLVRGFGAGSLGRALPGLGWMIRNIPHSITGLLRAGRIRRCYSAALQSASSQGRLNESGEIK